ncbi:SMP-30/gluconolactonase/LRE family protein [Qaidamihabitans albus]|uniref:SMP-30/gluconolactonase/LRE family protein n=1 Tax=Qaidamihabitans albus TaxID=2795733 RepID=UPI0018F1B166|nr:SMP-30/gluconolactonase/LRE family protein [Qaidamihabitans albus]
MPGREALNLVREFLFPGRHRGSSIPPLDGGLTPNDRLDELEPAHEAPVQEPDDVVLDADGSLLVTSGRSLLRLSGPRFRDRSVVASFDGEAGAIARDGDGGVFVCVAGAGLLRVGPDATTTVVTDVADDGQPVQCPTGVAVAGDGTVYLTDGSKRHHGGDWVRDLMELNALGRLLRCPRSGGRAQVLADGLRYPSGLCLSPEEDALVVSEAWAHRLVRYPLADIRSPEQIRANLPGYPGRIAPAADGGYWLAVFALRTQLVEFVLTQRDYVEQMMRIIEPDYWIRPALRTLNSGLEPLQGGQIRKLGVIKPWAPPRSYGLVARIEEDGHAQSSLHSRGGANRHGVTSARQFGDRLLIAARGGDLVLESTVGGMR